MELRLQRGGHILNKATNILFKPGSPETQSEMGVLMKAICWRLNKQVLAGTYKEVWWQNQIGGGGMRRRGQDKLSLASIWYQRGLWSVNVPNWTDPTWDSALGQSFGICLQAAQQGRYVPPRHPRATDDCQPWMILGERVQLWAIQPSKLTAAGKRAKSGHMTSSTGINMHNIFNEGQSWEWSKRVG